jgi:hypothetical protein
MNANHESINRVNSSLKTSAYISCHQYLSKQCILRAQLGFNNLPLTINRALVTNSANTMSI